MVPGMQQASFFPTEAHLANEGKLRMALAVTAARHAVAHRARGVAPGHIAPARIPPPTEDGSCGVSADAPGPETLGRFAPLDRSVAPSVSVSTSTGSCSESAQEDGSEALASARSELANDDLTPQVIDREESIPQVIDAEADEIGHISKCEVHDEDCRVIDPEADEIDPKADKSRQISECPVAQEESEAVDSKAEDLPRMNKSHVNQQSQGHSTGAEVEIMPDSRDQESASCAPADENSMALNAVLGSWWDAKLSFYEVSFDKESNSSCHVKTTRPVGGVRETRGLIRMGQARGKTLGRVIWGSAFILETPIKNPNRLQWRSIRGGKDFMWTRETEDEEDTEGGAEESWHIASPVEAVTGSVAQAPKPELQPPITNEECTSFSEQREKRSIQKRVWRAVDGKPLVVAKPDESSKTPSEIAAAPRRRTKARNGEWRELDKNRRT